MKAKKYIITFAFVAWLVFFAVFSLILKDSEFSHSERRQLEQFESYSEKKEAAEKLRKDYGLAEYFSWIETYLIEQFPARDNLRAASTAARFYMLMQSDYNGYYIAENSACCMDPEIDTVAVSQNAQYINRIYNKFFEQIGANVYYSVIPDKNYFYAEKNGFLHYDYSEFMKLYSDTVSKDIDYIDIFPLLSGDDYYITDPHWNQTEIIPVANHLLEGMGTEVSRSDYEEVILEDFKGTYSGHLAIPLPEEDLVILTNDVISGCRVLDYTSFNPIREKVYDLADYENVDPYDVFLGGATKSLLKIENRACSNGKQLIVFRDSFGSSIVPLMIESYSEIVVVDLRLISPAEINKHIEFNPECDVLFLLSTSILNSGGVFPHQVF